MFPSSSLSRWSTFIYELVVCFRLWVCTISCDSTFVLESVEYLHLWAGSVLSSLSLHNFLLIPSSSLSRWSTIIYEWVRFIPFTFIYELVACFRLWVCMISYVTIFVFESMEYLLLWADSVLSSLILHNFLWFLLRPWVAGVPSSMSW